MATAIEQEIRHRAAHRCEYCRIPELAFRLPFEIDHVISKQHGGTGELDNLALCCLRCNRCKGPNIAGIDPQSGNLTRLFHPRKDRWADHFRWDGPLILGVSDVGRTTVQVLAMNEIIRISLRRSLMAERRFFAST